MDFLYSDAGDKRALEDDADSNYAAYIAAYTSKSNHTLDEFFEFTRRVREHREMLRNKRRKIAEPQPEVPQVVKKPARILTDEEKKQRAERRKQRAEAKKKLQEAEADKPREEPVQEEKEEEEEVVKKPQPSLYDDDDDDIQDIIDAARGEKKKYKPRKKLPLSPEQEKNAAEDAERKRQEAQEKRKAEIDEALKDLRQKRDSQPEVDDDVPGTTDELERWLKEELHV